MVDKKAIGYMVMLSLVFVCFGAVIDNIAPDYSDLIYFQSVLDGSISDPTWAFLCYEIFPSVQWILLGLFIFGVWYTTKNTQLAIRVGVWAISFVMISATVLLFILYASLMGTWVMVADIIACVGCIIAVLQIEHKLGDVWKKIKSLEKEKWVLIIYGCLGIVFFFAVALTGAFVTQEGWNIIDLGGGVYVHIHKTLIGYLAIVGAVLIRQWKSEWSIWIWRAVLLLGIVIIVYDVVFFWNTSPTWTLLPIEPI